MIVRAAWILLALIHLVPALALFRPAMLTSLYGVAPASPTFLLLHHRAALFLVIVLMCTWAVVDPSGWRLASVCVAVSMLSFLLLYWLAGTPASLRTIAMADLIGLPALAVAAWFAFR